MLTERMKRNPMETKCLQLGNQRFHLFNNLVHIALICIAVISCVNAKSLKSPLTDIRYENVGNSDINRNAQFVDEDDDNLRGIENVFDDEKESNVSTDVLHEKIRPILCLMSL